MQTPIPLPSVIVARSLVEGVVEALESEKPLAVVEGQLFWRVREVWIAPSSDEAPSIYLPNKIFKERIDNIPVTVTITERHDA